MGPPGGGLRTRAPHRCDSSSVDTCEHEYDLRWALFIGAALAVWLVYAVTCRYLRPAGAALATWLAPAWSFPITSPFCRIPSRYDRPSPRTPSRCSTGTRPPLLAASRSANSPVPSGDVDIHPWPANRSLLFQ